MNLQQLEYIVAVDKYRHFARAAEACFVTQPTLSMMIQKLETELDVRIFDRSRQPVEPTAIGTDIIRQARKVLAEANSLREIVREQCERIGGAVRLGVIPTLSPYILPLFVRRLLDRYPGLSLDVEELNTAQIMEHLRTGRLDLGLLATPLQQPDLAERPLFNERFYAYVSEQEPQFQKQYLLPDRLNVNRLWILEEGHCFRNQVLNLCKLNARQRPEANFRIEAGSFETVMRLVENYHGLTIIPELLVGQLTAERRSRVRAFAPPAPVREVSLVTLHHFPRQRVVKALAETILASIPENIRDQPKEEGIVRIPISE